RPDHRGERDRKKPPGGDHSSGESPPHRSLRDPELRQHLRRVAGKRTVRARKGGFHRRLGKAAGKVRAGSGGDGLPGRGKRAWTPPPREAPPGGAGENLRAALRG